MRRIAFDPKETYELTFLQGKPFLFTDYRIQRDTIPEGYCMYEVAEGEDGACFARITYGVMVNFFGTLIGAQELTFEEGENAYYPEYPSLESLGTFQGTMTLAEYQASDFAGYERENRIDESEVILEGHRYSLSVDVYTDGGEPDLEALEDDMEEMIYEVREIHRIVQGPCEIPAYVRAEGGFRLTVAFTAGETLAGSCLRDHVLDLLEECEDVESYCDDIQLEEVKN